MRSMVTAMLVLAMAVTAAPVSALESDDPVERLSGANRSATAAAVSTYCGPTDTVVVARGDDYPDSLAAAPLAAAVNGPVLLTPTASANRETLDEIARLQPDRVVVIGGAHAVSDAAAHAIAEVVGAPVARIAGTSRYETTAWVAREVYAARAAAATGRLAYLALGGRPPGWEPGEPLAGWPDAVAGGALAAAAGAPLLLTEGSVLPRDTAEAIADLGIERVVVVGGEAAVGATVVEAVRELGVEVERVAGPTRYETATAAAQAAVDAGADPSTTIFATGREWPDAVSGSALAGRLGVPMVLVDGRNFHARPAAGIFIERFGVQRGLVLGGESAVAAPALEALEERILSARATSLRSWLTDASGGGG